MIYIVLYGTLWCAAQKVIQCRLSSFADYTSPVENRDKVVWHATEGIYSSFTIS